MAVAFRTRDASVSGWGAYSDSDVDDSLRTMVSLVWSSIAELDWSVGRRWQTVSVDELTLNGEGRDDALAHPIHESGEKPPDPRQSHRIYLHNFLSLPPIIYHPYFNLICGLTSIFFRDLTRYFPSNAAAMRVYGSVLLEFESCALCTSASSHSLLL